MPLILINSYLIRIATLDEYVRYTVVATILTLRFVKKRCKRYIAILFKPVVGNVGIR